MLDECLRHDDAHPATATAGAASPPPVEVPPWSSVGVPPPDVPGLPLIGALGMLLDPIQHIVGWFREYGPIFRVRLGGRAFVVLAGVEANRFIASGTDSGALSSESMWSDFKNDLNSNAAILGLDGEQHARVRKLVKPGYAVDLVHRRLPETFGIVDRAIGRLQAGAKLELLPFFQRLVTEQLGRLLTGTSPASEFDDLELFMRTALNAAVLGLWPRFLLRRPAYQRAKTRLRAFMRELVRRHRSAQRADGGPDLVDRLLAGVDADRAEPSLTQDDLFLLLLQPFLAGIDTSGTAATFATQRMLSEEGVLERVRSEADDLYAGGLDPARLGKCVALRGLLLESLRLHPIAPILLRRATRSFDVLGHRVEAGQELLFAIGTTNFLSEYFTEPLRFDIDRHRRDQHERRPASSFVPFGCGPHACLGARIAEVQVMSILAAVARHGRFRAEAQPWQLRLSQLPVPNGRGLFVRVQDGRFNRSATQRSASTP